MKEITIDVPKWIFPSAEDMLLASDKEVSMHNYRIMTEDREINIFKEFSEHVVGSRISNIYADMLSVCFLLSNNYYFTVVLEHKYLTIHCSLEFSKNIDTFTKWDLLEDIRLISNKSGSSVWSRKETLGAIIGEQITMAQYVPPLFCIDVIGEDFYFGHLINANTSEAFLQYGPS